MMGSVIQVETMLGMLGKSHSELLALGLIPNGRLRKIFPEDEDAYLQIEPGLCYSFYSKAKVLRAVIVTLIKQTPSSETFHGALSEPYPCPDKASVRTVWGEPAQSRGPLVMPRPMGRVGGWDLYGLAPRGFSDAEILYKYTANLEVSGIAFSLKPSLSEETS